MRGRNSRMWWGTALEAPDPGALARFYTDLLDWPIVEYEETHAVLKPPQDGVFLVIQRADDYVAPVWPPVSGEQRPMMHMDVQVDDLDGAVADAITLGAREASSQPQDNVRVMLDPAGHPFCLCVEQN
jgi:hypothetical protein